MQIDYERDGLPRTVILTPKVESEKDLKGKTQRIGRIGIQPSRETVTLKHAFGVAVYKGAERVIVLTGLIFSSLALLVTGGLSFKESFTGPIGIYYLTQQAADFGWIPLFSFSAALSVSLFVLNLLPIPVLDGGHLLFLGIEKLRGRPLSVKIENILNQIGMTLLIGLMVYVTYIDIVRHYTNKDIQRQNVEQTQDNTD